jgi:type I restriction enzyme S subunit
MASNWGKICTLEYGKALRNYAPEPSDENEYRVFGTNGPIGWTSTPLTDGPGIVVGRKGAYRGVHFSPAPFFVIDTAYYVKPKGNALDLQWLYYKLLTVDINRIDVGAAIPTTSREAFYSLPVDVPSVEKQTIAAQLLSAYDNLIENNRRRMQLLEEAARLLYQEWFVHLRFPGHEKTTIKDGVPDKWERKSLSDLSINVREVVMPEELDSETPYIGLEHMPRRSISLTDWGHADAVTSAKHRFLVGDILFGKIRPYFHKVGIAFIDGVASSDAIVIRPALPEFQEFVLMTASSDPFVAEVSQTVKEGSKMPRADWKLMTKYPVLLPPARLLKAFSESINLITKQLRTLCFQNQKLRTTRDLLLPELMSGEIAV